VSRQLLQVCCDRAIAKARAHPGFELSLGNSLKHAQKVPAYCAKIVLQTPPVARDLPKSSGPNQVMHDDYPTRAASSVRAFCIGMDVAIREPATFRQAVNWKAGDVLAVEVSLSRGSNHCLSIASN
jgi:hypothetical protein